MSSFTNSFNSLLKRDQYLKHSKYVWDIIFSMFRNWSNIFKRFKFRSLARMPLILSLMFLPFPQETRSTIHLTPVPDIDRLQEGVISEPHSQSLRCRRCICMQRQTIFFRGFVSGAVCAGSSLPRATLIKATNC